MKYTPWILCGIFQIAQSEMLSLKQALNHALDQSIQMQILKANKANSAALVEEVGSVVYPKLEFTASAGIGQSPMGIKPSSTGSIAPDFSKLKGDPDSAAVAKSMLGVGQLLGNAFKFDTDPRSNYRWGFQLTQPIYTFGKLSTAIEVSHYQDSATAQQFRRGRQEIQNGVIEAYTGMILAQKAEVILKSADSRAKELHSFLKRNFDMGSGSKADLLRSEAALTQIQVRLNEAKRDRKRAQMALNQVMGQEINQEFEVDTLSQNIPWMKDPLRTEAELYQEAKDQRADLKALQMQSRIYAGGETIDRANYLPSIALQAKAGMTGYDEVGNAFKWENRDWSVGVGLSWTLFDGFSNRAKAEQKKIQAQILSKQSENVQRQIQMDLSRVQRDLEVALSSQKAGESVLLALNESLQIQNRDFKAGKGTLSEILSTQESLEQAELQLLAAKWSEIKSKATLRYIQGQDLIGENP